MWNFNTLVLENFRNNFLSANYTSFDIYSETHAVLAERKYTLGYDYMEFMFPIKNNVNPIY